MDFGPYACVCLRHEQMRNCEFGANIMCTLSASPSFLAWFLFLSLWAQNLLLASLYDVRVVSVVIQVLKVLLSNAWASWRRRPAKTCHKFHPSCLGWIGRLSHPDPLLRQAQDVSLACLDFRPFLRSLFLSHPRCPGPPLRSQQPYVMLNTRGLHFLAFQPLIRGILPP